MSITSGFEGRAWSAYVGHFYTGEVLALLNHARSLEAQNEELKAMLKKHQWTDGTSEHCPECGAWDPQGHSPDCALAKLLG